MYASQFSVPSSHKNLTVCVCVYQLPQDPTQCEYVKKKKKCECEEHLFVKSAARSVLKNAPFL